MKWVVIGERGTDRFASPYASFKRAEADARAWEVNGWFVYVTRLLETNEVQRKLVAEETHSPLYPKGLV